MLAREGEIRREPSHGEGCLQPFSNTVFQQTAFCLVHSGAVEFFTMDANFKKVMNVVVLVLVAPADY